MRELGNDGKGEWGIEGMREWGMKEWGMRG